MKRNFILLGLLLAGTFLGQAQTKEQVTTLSLEAAVDLGLQNNHALRIQRKQTEIAQNNVFVGNSGQLPTISLVGNGNYSNNNSDLEIRTFQQDPAPPLVRFDESGVASTTLNAVVQADYIVFAGFSGRYRYQLSQTQLGMAKLKQEALIQQTVVDITTLFGEIVKLQRQEELLQETLEIDRERLQKVQDRFDFGKATGLEILRAKTDLNTDTNALEEVTLAREKLLSQLNVLIGKPAAANYRLSMVFERQAPKSEAELMKTAQQKNPLLQLARQGQLAAEQQLALSRSASLPQLSAFANYGYFNQQNDVQQLAEIENIGYGLGLSFRYQLFNGNQNRKATQTARLGGESALLKTQQAEARIEAQVAQEWNTLQTLNRQLVRREQDLKTYEETFARTRDRYFNGKLSSLDLREVQMALLQAKMEVDVTKVNIVQTTIRLNALTGELQQVR